MPMQVGDLERTTRGRFILNTYYVPRMVQVLKNGDEVLFVGTDTSWDYKSLFWNPSKQCPFTTVDIAERYHPDIVADIQNCPQLESNKYSLILFIGMHEFLDRPADAYSELHRLLVTNGYLLVAFPGKGYYPDNRGVSYQEVPQILNKFRVLEVMNVFEGNVDPNSIITLSQKL